MSITFILSAFCRIYIGFRNRILTISYAWLRTGVVSSLDVSLDLEVNGFARSNEHQEIILAKGLRCFGNSGVSVRHLSKHQELDLYIKELAQVVFG